MPPSPRTAYHASCGWLVTTVGARGEDWGRVILACDGPPGPVDTALVERTATTLALGRLLARQQESLERQAHRTLISTILAEPAADPDEAAAQARALGVPVTGRQLITAVIRSRGGGAGLLAQARVLDLAEAVAEACRAERIPALVGSLDDVRAGALLSVDSAADPERVLAGVCEVVRLGLARPTLYERLRHIERILGISLESAESRSSLHVALLARDSARAAAAAR
ncbi:MAG TPA: helix-turn-helix domain-containing protein [Streptosporangiaceae bacterium]|nr:helix-turn-helix domain-containing protein [Streptosporangiaceae bacterium]